MSNQNPHADFQHYFEFLDALRLSGDFNMFGAAPILSERFAIGDHAAKTILIRWMETFAERHPQEETK